MKKSSYLCSEDMLGSIVCIILLFSIFDQEINNIINKNYYQKKEMKEMNNKKNYISPMVEILNARVEKGFAGSNAGMDGAPEPIHGENELGDFD